MTESCLIFRGILSSMRRRFLTSSSLVSIPGWREFLWGTRSVGFIFSVLMDACQGSVVHGS